MLKAHCLSFFNSLASRVGWEVYPRRPLRPPQIWSCGAVLFKLDPKNLFLTVGILAASQRGCPGQYRHGRVDDRLKSIAD